MYCTERILLREKIFVQQSLFFGEKRIKVL